MKLRNKGYAKGIATVQPYLSCPKNLLLTTYDLQLENDTESNLEYRFFGEQCASRNIWDASIFYHLRISAQQRII